MFIPIWILIIVPLILIWSVWMNINRSKQIHTLKYAFVTISDLAINKLREIKSERAANEGGVDLIPFVITESLNEVETTVNHLLESQQNAGVSPYTVKDGINSLGI